MKNFSILFLVLSLITMEPAFADGKYTVKDTILINEVVVTGTPVKVNREYVPMSVSIITRSQLEESDESALLPVLNGRVPGLFVTERGVTGFGVSDGAAGQISIRGIGSNPTTGVLVLIDGHPQFMGLFGHPLADSYVASDAERVEVIRGPGSVLYGSNAMGGVINIITKKQTKEGLNGNARLMYGSFNTQKYRASTGYRKDKLSIFASVNHDQTDGHRDNSDFKITNGYLKTGYEFSKNLTGAVDFSLAGFKTSDPGPDTLHAEPGEKLDITRGYWSASLNNDFGKMSGTGRFYHNFGKHDITDGFHSTDHNWGINLYESFKLLKGNNFTVGVDYANYGGKARNKISNTFLIDTTVYELGIYGFIQQNLSGKITLDAGLRYNDHRTYGSEWIPSFGTTFQLAKQTSWKVSVSKGYRSPTLRELFLWGPNPDLRPESIWDYETGIIHSCFDRKLNLELTGYILKGDNLIQRVAGKGYQNSGEVSNKGIELSADARVNDHFDFYMAYSYIHMKTPVYGTPENQLFISGNYRFKKLLLNASVQEVAGLDTDSSTSVSKESYTLVDAKASYRLCKLAQLFVKGENLLDQKYETLRYYTMPGITVFAGVNLNF